MASKHVQPPDASPSLHEGISVIISPDAPFMQGYIFHDSNSPIRWLQKYV